VPTRHPRHHAGSTDDRDADPRGLRARRRVDDPQVLAKVFDDRSRKHARNAYWMLFDPDQLSRRAGQGVRQGFGDAGPLTSA